MLSSSDIANLLEQAQKLKATFDKFAGKLVSEGIIDQSKLSWSSPQNGEDDYAKTTVSQPPTNSQCNYDVKEAQFVSIFPENETTLGAHQMFDKTSDPISSLNIDLAVGNDLDNTRTHEICLKNEVNIVFGCASKPTCSDEVQLMNARNLLDEIPLPDFIREMAKATKIEEKTVDVDAYQVFDDLSTTKREDLHVPTKRKLFDELPLPDFIKEMYVLEQVQLVGTESNLTAPNANVSIVPAPLIANHDNPRDDTSFLEADAICLEGDFSLDTELFAFVEYSCGRNLLDEMQLSNAHDKMPQPKSEVLTLEHVCMIRHTLNQLLFYEVENGVLGCRKKDMEFGNLVRNMMIRSIYYYILVFDPGVLFFHLNTCPYTQLIKLKIGWMTNVNYDEVHSWDRLYVESARNGRLFDTIWLPSVQYYGVCYLLDRSIRHGFVIVLARMYFKGLGPNSFEVVCLLPSFVHVGYDTVWPPSLRYDPELPSFENSVVAKVFGHHYVIDLAWFQPSDAPRVPLSVDTALSFIRPLSYADFDNEVTIKWFMKQDGYLLLIISTLYYTGVNKPMSSCTLILTLEVKCDFRGKEDEVQAKHIRTSHKTSILWCHCKSNRINKGVVLFTQIFDPGGLCWQRDMWDGALYIFRLVQSVCKGVNDMTKWDIDDFMKYEMVQTQYVWDYKSDTKYVIWIEACKSGRVVLAEFSCDVVICLECVTDYVGSHLSGAIIMKFCWSIFQNITDATQTGVCYSARIKLWVLAETICNSDLNPLDAKIFDPGGNDIFHTGETSCTSTVIGEVTTLLKWEPGLLGFGVQHHNGAIFVFDPGGLHISTCWYIAFRIAITYYRRRPSPLQLMSQI